MISHLVSVVVVSAFVIAGAALYLLPVLVGYARHIPGIAVIAVINVFLGWTFLGWIVALALALRPAYPPSTLVQVVQNPPPHPPVLPPGRQPDAGWAGPPGPPPSRPDSPPPLSLPSEPADSQEEATHGR